MVALAVLSTVCARRLGAADADRPAGEDDEPIELVAVVDEDVVEPFNPKRELSVVTESEQDDAGMRLANSEEARRQEGCLKTG